MEVQSALTCVAGYVGCSKGNCQSSSRDLDCNKEHTSKEQAAIVSWADPTDQSAGDGDESTCDDANIPEISPFACNIAHEQDAESCDGTDGTSQG